MKPTLYLSLPITGRDINEAKSQAEHTKKRLSKFHHVITPFDVCPEQDRPYSYYMGKDIEALLECDAIYMCPGWEESKGCMAEHAIAKIYGKEILK